jgi:NAD(P)-dependent dehydrogenase (short-subunit alcohol dehydrogenase family)
MDRQSALQGKVILITGASRGLGHALALAFAREHATLSLCARGRADLEKVGAEAGAAGADVLTVAADLRSPRDIERVVSLTLERFGRIDVLINNASELGPTPLPNLVDYPPEAFDDVLLVNLAAPFRLTQAVLGGMLQRRSGVVINVTSDVAVHGYSGWGAYAVSKAALEGLTRTWAAELAGTGVRLHVVDPGDMDTAMHRAALPDDDPRGLAKPEGVAAAFVRLASEGSHPPGDRLEARALLGARA